MICAVSAQKPRFDGLSTIVASLIVEGDVSLNDKADEGVDDTPLGESNAWTRQKKVARDASAPALTWIDVCPPPCSGAVPSKTI